MWTLSFVPINVHRCWPREWKRSINVSSLMGVPSGPKAPDPPRPPIPDSPMTFQLFITMPLPYYPFSIVISIKKHHWLFKNKQTFINLLIKTILTSSPYTIFVRKYFYHNSALRLKLMTIFTNSASPRPLNFGTTKTTRVKNEIMLFLPIFWVTS